MPLFRTAMTRRLALSVIVALPVAHQAMLSAIHSTSTGEVIWIPYGNMGTEESATPTIQIFGHRHRMIGVAGIRYA